MVPAEIACGVTTRAIHFDRHSAMSHLRENLDRYCHRTRGRSRSRSPTRDYADAGPVAATAPMSAPVTFTVELLQLFPLVPRTYLCGPDERCLTQSYPSHLLAAYCVDDLKEKIVEQVQANGGNTIARRTFEVWTQCGLLHSHTPACRQHIPRRRSLRTLWVQRGRPSVLPLEVQVSPSGWTDIMTFVDAIAT